MNPDSNADNPEFKRRVVASGVLLVAAKLLNVSIPIILKTAVDAMTGEVSAGRCDGASALSIMRLGAQGGQRSFGQAAACVDPHLSEDCDGCNDRRGVYA